MPIFFTLLSLQASKTWKNKRPTISIKISSREPHHLCLSIPTIRDRSNTSNEPPSSKICLRTQLECRLDCQQHGQKRPFNAHFEAREEEIKNQTYKTTRLHCWYCDNKDQRSLGNALTEKSLPLLSVISKRLHCWCCRVQKRCDASKNPTVKPIPFGPLYSTIKKSVSTTIIAVPSSKKKTNTVRTKPSQKIMALYYCRVNKTFGPVLHAVMVSTIT